MRSSTPGSSSSEWKISTFFVRTPSCDDDFSGAEPCRGDAGDGSAAGVLSLVPILSKLSVQVASILIIALKGVRFGDLRFSWINLAVEGFVARSAFHQ